MKKHSLEEKIGLKIELKRISFFILFFCLGSEVMPQIPINGFCKLNSYQFSPGYSKLVSLNYNNDSYSDLVFLNPSSKFISVAAGEKNESFSEELKFEFPYQLSNLVPIREKNFRIKNYAFTSRKDLVAGICKFSSDGKPKISHQMSFKSYPQNLSVADVNDDNEQEILISGSAFEGLSLITLVGNKLIEIKIPVKGSYSDAIFTDLNNDEFPDIAAINLLSNSLEFLTNNGRGEFNLVRRIQLVQKAGNLHVFDMNLDSYNDLIFIEGNTIKILYGDFSSSYSKQVELLTSHLPNELIIGDFNKDGKIDISYLSFSLGIVSAILAETEFNFFREVPILQKGGLKCLIPFYSKFIDGLAVINDEGILLTNTRLTSLSTDHDISLCLEPNTINYFDANKDGINDFCFIDNFDNSLKLVVRNSAGVPTSYYSLKLRGSHSEIISKNFSKQATSFFCYSAGKKLIEEIKVEFNSGIVQRSEFYTSRPISGLSVVYDDHEKIFASSLTNQRLTLEIFEKEENWNLLLDYNISEKAISSYLSTFNGLKLFFWNQDGDSIKLFMKTFLPEELKATLVAKRKMTKVSKILTVVNDFMNLEKESVISFVESNEKMYILINNGRFINSFYLKTVNKNLLVNFAEQLVTGEIRTNGTTRLIINNPSDQIVYYLNILKGGKQIIFSKMFPEINAGSFFVKNMTAKNYHLVYLNYTKSCISVRQI